MGRNLEVYSPAMATSVVELFAPVQEGLAAVEACMRQVVDGQHDALTAATERLLNAGGKRVRPAIALLTASIFAADFDHSVSLAAAVEMLHTATLVHDDLIDAAFLRRGLPTLNATLTPAVTVLTGDYLFARAASLVARTNNVRVMHLFAETLMIILNGEVKQQFAKGRVDRRDYYERIYAKTAAMFVLATQSAALLGGADEASLAALFAFGRSVGMAFQIIDDVLDLVGSAGQIGKPVGSDLCQGLITLPVIHYFERHPDDPNLNALLNGRVGDPGIIPRVVAAVRESDAIDAALREARDLVAQGRYALEKLPRSDGVAALSAVAQFIVDRDL